jgi:hypothetical protein
MPINKKPLRSMVRGWSIRARVLSGRGAALLICTQALAACAWLPVVPKTDHDVGTTTGPTVAEIVKHINCELTKSLYAHHAFEAPSPNDALWQNLVKYKAVAAITMDLEVDVMRGFDPQVGYIDPLHGGVMMQNASLTVSGQFNDTTSRHVTLDVFVDLERLKGAAPVVKDKDGAESIGNCAVTSGIGGDLRLEETLATGLSALDAVAKFNVYDNRGPPNPHVARLAAIDNELLSALNQPKPDSPAISNLVKSYSSVLGDVSRDADTADPQVQSALKHADQSLDTYAAKLQETIRTAGDPEVALQATNELYGVVKPAQDKANGLAKPAKSAASPGGTSFGTQVDFTIVRNYGGGPSLSLIHWKVGAAGGGGGSGGGASGGGGGGGGGNMLSFNTTVTDSLTIQIGLTCTDNAATKNPQDYWQAIPNCTEAHKSETMGVLQNKNYNIRLNSLLQGMRQ